METVDFNIDTRDMDYPYVDFLGIRLGHLDANDFEKDISAYNLSVDDVLTMHDMDLGYHLSKWGIDYIAEKHEYELREKMENRLSNGGLTDDELLRRFEDSMHGHNPVRDSSNDFEY